MPVKSKAQNANQPTPTVSVIMPVYNQAHFIRRALESIKAQTLGEWELLIVDDGSTDDVGALLAPYLADGRIRYQRFEQNRGMGAALNSGLEQARGSVIAYLPADDVYYPAHLATLVAALQQHPEAPLAYSGARHHYNKLAPGQIEGYSLQMVQTMHRQSDARWIERDELVTDDLGRMFWHKLGKPDTFVGTSQVTCEWVNHPMQRHKVIHEDRGGGINPYRVRYNVQQPLRFHSSIGNPIDEISHYRRFRERPDTPPSPDGLKILLVGELAYNAERVLALEERGHKLYGLWTHEPMWFNTVGPVPFGHVEDLPRNDWQNAIKRIKPDVIYALLNWQTVSFAHHVLTENPGVPFVWHFKEGPFICLEKGLWSQLVDLYTRSEGRIYSSPEMRDWFYTIVPELRDQHSLVLDGDLPKRDWFDAPRSPRLSEQDGQMHTVVPGRPIGLHPWTVGELAEQGIHLHFYGDFTQGVWRTWIEKANAVAEGYLHLHPNVGQDGWVREFSQYDAGWLHFFKSENEGDLRRSNWDDLNYPARIATLAVSGLPLLQYDNQGAVVASQTLAREYDIGLFFTNMEQLRAQLKDKRRMKRVRENVWRQREQFMFDTHTDRLIDYLKQVTQR
jgi:glycosyltransferase involved in cell wall biosynthesis